jgi:membrane-bound inhibitor of C-type lysozyme
MAAPTAARKSQYEPGRGGRMPLRKAGFKSQQAPCGQIVDGESYQDQDEEVLVTEELDYDCGCRTIRHEYHDGSVSAKVVRHDGTILVDELLSAE